MTFNLLKNRPRWDIFLQLYLSGWFHLDLQNLFFIVSSTYKCSMVVFVLSSVPDGHTNYKIVYSIMHSSLILQNYSVSDLLDALNWPLQGRVDAVRNKKESESS